MSARTSAIALLAFTLLLPTSARAQVNIESLRSDDVPDGISGALTGNLVVKTGNTDFVELSGNARLNWVRGPGTTLLIADGGLGFLRGNRFASGGLLHLRHTRWLNDRVAGEAFGQMNYDRPQLLDFRSLLGAGVRLRVGSGAWGALGAGSSIMIEEERLDLPASAVHPDRTTTWRNSTFVTVRLVAGDNLVVSSTAYLQPALSDLSDDLRIIENLSVAAALTDRLALNVTFDLRYDSGPPDEIEALDTQLKTGLTFRS
jgi:hypothetical protein